MVLRDFKVINLIENLPALHIPYTYSAVSTAYTYSPTAVVLAPRTTEKRILETGGRAHENAVYTRWRRGERTDVMDDSLGRKGGGKEEVAIG